MRHYRRRSSGAVDGVVVMDAIMREDGAAASRLCLSRRDVAVSPAALLAAIPAGGATVVVDLVMAVLAVCDLTAMFAVGNIAAMLATNLMAWLAILRHWTSVVVVAEVVSSFCE